ncbi:MAG: hypothetical protein JNM56_16380 [Planctomycetia bacterium]|nr:hypothetical protein [Planctomycetia bacterium]
MLNPALAISTTCPHCGAGLIVPVHFGGELHPCPACGQEIVVPMIEDHEDTLSD